MGQSVPTMLRPAAYGTRALAGAVLALGRGTLGPCTQCGAPDETAAHLCAYCLSPRHRAKAHQMIEVTTLCDAAPRFVPAMQDESFRK